MNDECISLINVSKKYSGNSDIKKMALNNISLTINKGEFVGIAGMNGSGKSTLVGLLNGLILPTSGEVKVNGMSTLDRKNIMHIRNLVGMVFQNPDNQIVNPIVEEDIAFGPINLGLSKQQVKERTNWALKVLGLEELRDHSPHLLSGGQKQKVAIASALAMRPSYLILDEPTSMLDNESRRELLATLKFLNSELGITIVLISHHMDDMAEVNRLIVLNKGQICYDDIPWRLFTNPEKLMGVGLSVPRIVYLLNSLRERGHKIDQKIITLNQSEKFICRLLK